MGPEELKQYIKKEKESDYLVVDVRQPEEYVRGHIPGAKLIPIMELVADLSRLPSDKDLTFYCHSGGRSGAAVTLAMEEEVSTKNIHNLDGGIVAWDGRKVADYPRVQVFDKSKSLSELLLTTMDLEKGALRFYDYLKDRSVSDRFSKTMGRLSKAEITHAKVVYGQWRTYEQNPPKFETVFERLEGEILEGGENLVDILQRTESLEGNTCLNLIELALHFENSALDLYRTMAEKTENKKTRQVFLDIAQAEKMHMKDLIDGIHQCDEQNGVGH
jgi:rhodanese-related sulfurtransferase/rubrerythrin